MTLLEAWLAVVSDWSDCFPQRRTFRHAVRQALGALVCQGRRCLWRIIWTNGGQHRSWSSEYFLHSRCPWELPSLWSCAAPWPTVPAAWSASLSTIPDRARRDAALPRPSISATPCRRPFMST
jgi:hypothetical protein